MAQRYDDRIVFNNRHSLYRKKAKDRNIKFFRHYETARFRNVSREDMEDIDVVEMIWTPGQRLYKLAHRFYGDSEYWWVIAWFNERPTDAEFKPGDPVLVPLPLEDMVALFAEDD
tara:strand:+ start:80 stop:424 length:345 start_codon:yes stop_codon:yes gene_type:complete